MIFDFEEVFNTYHHTSKVEHTSLIDIDRAVAAWMLSLINQMHVHDDERPEYQELKQFYQKTALSKLFIGEFDSADDFLKKLSARHQKNCDDDVIRNDLLPVMYTSRDLTISYAERDGQTDLYNVGQQKISDTHDISISKSYPILSYKLHVLAWQQHTACHLAMSILMYLRHTRANSHHKFKAKTQLAGKITELNVALTGSPGYISEAQPLMVNEKRLYGQTITLEFETEQLEATWLERQKVTLKGKIVNE